MGSAGSGHVNVACREASRRIRATRNGVFREIRGDWQWGWIIDTMGNLVQFFVSKKTFWRVNWSTYCVRDSYCI